MLLLLLLRRFSRVRLFATPRTVAYQALQSMGFSRQEYWSRLPFPSPRDLPSPGPDPGSPALEADTLPTEPPGKNGRKTQQQPAHWALLNHVNRNPHAPIST